MYLKINRLPDYFDPGRIRKRLTALEPTREVRTVRRV